MSIFEVKKLTQLKASFLHQYKKTNLMKRFQFIFISFFMLTLLSCDKSENEETRSIYGKWEATDFISLESVAYPKKDGFNPIIEFKNDGTTNLQLDANGCPGNFSLLNENGISISASACTEKCCDSKFSEKFVQMLPQVKTYRFEKNKLKLEVPDWGWINLELND
jgi:heat shock protein HslJ